MTLKRSRQQPLIGFDQRSEPLQPPSAMHNAADARAPAVLPVSLLVGSVRLILERQIGLVWVAGEISNFVRAASGHCYFNLKDDQAQIRCVLFRHKAQYLSFQLKEGQQVEARAVATVFEARGDLQLNVETLRLAGQGALYERFAQLKARLEAAGWFAPERKRPLPRFPRAVGIVTSTRAAALSDLLTTLRRRWPALRVTVYPTAVQGEGAAAEIAAAIGLANARNEVDVLIVGRGGGSIEDLWAFNEEIVARAIYESVLPVVSAVGHETDFTIADFVADLRAPTPTAAATLVAPDRASIAREVESLAVRFQQAQARQLETRMQRIDALSRRLVHPAARLARQRQEVLALAGRLQRACGHLLAVRRLALAGPGRRLGRELHRPLTQATRLASAADSLRRSLAAILPPRASRLAAIGQSLAHLNPEAVLQRGYAIVTDGDGKIVQDAATLTTGETIAIAFARGGAQAQVTAVKS